MATTQHGSYSVVGWTVLILGEGHYRSNLEFIKGNNHDRKSMRSFIINEFCKYSAYVMPIAHAGYAQSIIADP